MSKSPFSQNRFELEQEHLFFLEKNTVDKLQGTKSCYIVGSRGTGKTTLLQSLRFECRQENASLKAALNNDAFKVPLMGLYQKLSEHSMQAFQYWEDAFKPEFFAKIFSVYLDLCWMPNAVQTIASSLEKGLMNLTTEDERDAVQRLFKVIKPDKPVYDTVPTTLRELEDYLRGMRKRVDLYCSTGYSITEEKLFLEFPFGNIGEIGREFGTILRDLLNKAEIPRDLPIKEDGDRDWFLKICFDETDDMSPVQQRVVNMLIRIAKLPISYVFTFSNPSRDFTTTTQDGLSNTNADLEIIDLVNISNKEFEVQAQGIASVRLQKYLNNSEYQFRLSTLLGEYRVNKLLSARFANSEKKGVRKLLKLARELSDKGYYQSSEELPIYQAYVISHEDLTLPTRSDTKTLRQFDSGKIRKRSAIAYFKILHELGLDPLYALDNILLLMSDGCIRDFLLMLDSIYKESGKTLEDFATKGEIEIKTQDKAIRKFSTEKIGQIPNIDVHYPKRTEQLVDLLGNITSTLHKQKLTKGSLDSAECGEFVLVVDPTIPEESELSVWINNAIVTGFLNGTFDEAKGAWKVRVHRSLAAHYEFSHRNSYYAVPLDTPEFAKVLVLNDKSRNKAYVKEAASKNISSDTNQLPGFDDV